MGFMVGARVPITRKGGKPMKVRGLKVSNPHGAFTYDVAVVFDGEETTVEVRANTMTEAAALVASAGYTLVEVPA
jgi:hypothetical protein